MSEEDFIVGYTLFKSGGFRTKYQHFNNLETAKMFTSNVNLKDNSKIYVPLDLYNKQKEEIKELKLITNGYDSYLGENMGGYKIIIADSKYFLNGTFVEKYISKDKIRERLKKLKEKEQELSDEQGYFGSSELQARIEELEELAEEV